MAKKSNTPRGSNKPSAAKPRASGHSSPSKPQPKDWSKGRSQPKPRPKPDKVRATTAQSDVSKAVFSWFPGHMQVAWRQLQEELRNIDALLLLLDARIPLTSQNPALVKSLSARNIPIITVLNKCDLAEPDTTARWAQHFRDQGHQVVLQSQKDAQAKGLQNTLEQLRISVFERWAKRGVQLQPLKLRVIGLPNVGKSTLLNRLAGRTAAKTGKKAGLTRGRSPWIQVGPGVLVMDSPGIMVPRIDTWEQAAFLAACGCVRREVLPVDKVANILLQQMFQRQKLAHYQEGRYHTNDLEELARRLGYLLKNEELDWERAAVWLLQNCFDSKFGPLSWEEAPCEPA